MPINPNKDVGGRWSEDGSAYLYDDGTVATRYEIAQLPWNHQAAQDANKGSEYGFRNPSSSGEFWNDPNSAWTKDWNNVLSGLGYQSKQADPNAPGGTLNTSQADTERDRLAPLLSQLQQQAATGGGAWEGSLADATRRTSNAAMALGQSQRGDYMSKLGNIGNAEAGIKQRAAGQDSILRAQSQAGAQGYLSNLLGTVGDNDASQAAAGAAANQGITELNSALAKNANSQITKDSTSFGGLASSLMSKGGEVPGRPEVFGDDERNDTVPAKLSPGEIVIPRSHAGSPEDAAAFVRALQARGGVQHMADGGEAGSGVNVKPSSSKDFENAIPSILLPHVGAALRGSGVAQEAPSIQNGGLLDTSKYDANRQAQLANADLIQQRANGAGLSAAPQQMGNAIDENINTAMQAGNRGVSAGDILNRTAAATQGSAGNAAATVANEQRGAQAQLGHSLSAQRARDLAFSTAHQQAAFRQTQINAGLGLEQQAALRGLLAGAGQAAAAGSSLAGKRDTSYDGNDKNNLTFDEGLSANEFENPYASSSYSGPADLHDSNDLWRGGKVKKYAAGGQVDSRGQDFVAALRRSGVR